VAEFSARTIIQEPQRGTGHAVQTGLRALAPARGTIVVAYGDMPLVSPAIFADVIAAAGAEAAIGLAITTARLPLPSNFGRIIRRGDAVAKIVEERDCTPAERLIDEMNAGIYAYDESALRAVIDDLRDDNAQRELYLTDTVELLLRAGRSVVPVVCADHRLVLGVNDRVELADARALLNRTLCETHMRAGVTIIDPATTYLEPDLVIGADSVIYPNTAIGGATAIGARVIAGPNTRISNATIGDGVAITESIVLDTQVAAHVRIGPFAHLRSGNVIGPDVQIGNFVELKNTTMHAGAKANHLAYLGDAAIGARANIGAGTITCNYDGVNKHRTEIGAGAFIGSNSTLVAPLRVGDGALTGGGAVVIRDVADGERVAGNPARPLPKQVRV
jgi:bifunctional UDP-N-acetylglucosamine pyrophosphorylase/glucosamine-1-phosphate N-acetyltransferase